MKLILLVIVAILLSFVSAQDSSPLINLMNMDPQILPNLMKNNWRSLLPTELKTIADTFIPQNH